MIDTVQRQSASRAAWLELRRERDVVRDGHRYLDEKRILLARELLARIETNARRRREFEQREALAREALAEACRRHGLEQCQVYPPLGHAGPAGSFEIQAQIRSYLGVPVVAARAAAAGGPEYVPVIECAAIDECARRFAGLLRDAVFLAAEEASLLRLEAEYQRTQRRVLALEKVVLPELDAGVRALGDALEELEQEEAIRVHLAAG